MEPNNKPQWMISAESSLDKADGELYFDDTQDALDQGAERGSLTLLVLERLFGARWHQLDDDTPEGPPPEGEINW